MSARVSRSYIALIAQCDAKLKSLENQYKEEKKEQTRRAIAREILKETQRRMKYREKLFTL